MTILAAKCPIRIDAEFMFTSKYGRNKTMMTAQAVSMQSVYSSCRDCHWAY